MVCAMENDTEVEREKEISEKRIQKDFRTEIFADVHRVFRPTVQASIWSIKVTNFDATLYGTRYATTSLSHADIGSRPRPFFTIERANAYRSRD